VREAKAAARAPDYFRERSANAYVHQRKDPVWVARQRAYNRAYYMRKKVRDILATRIPPSPE